MNINFIVIPAISLSISISLLWTAFITVGLFSKLKGTKKFKFYDNKNYNRKFTIIVPARNEQNVIVNMINRIKNQNYKNFEAIIAVNNSSDETFAIAKKEAEHDKRIKVIEFETKVKGKGPAINYLFENNLVTGDIITILDADNIIDEDYLTKASKYFSDPKIDGIQTRYRTSNTDDGVIPKMIEIETLVYIDSFQDFCDFFGISCYYGGTGQFIRRKTLDEIGLWSDCLIEDYELSLRMVKKKKRIVCTKDIIIYDEKPRTYEALIHQRKRWIKGQLQCMKKYFGKIFHPVHFLLLVAPINILSQIFLIFLYWANIFSFYSLFSYIYIPKILWGSVFLINILIISLIVAIKKPKYVIYLPQYLFFFAFHWYCVFAFAIFGKSEWSKTTHYGGKNG